MIKTQICFKFWFRVGSTDRDLNNINLCSYDSYSWIQIPKWGIYKLYIQKNPGDHLGGVAYFNSATFKWGPLGCMPINKVFFVPFSLFFWLVGGVGWGG